jgi:hypothetical protein
MKERGLIRKHLGTLELMIQLGYLSKACAIMVNSAIGS